MADTGYKADGEKPDYTLLCFESLAGAARARMVGNVKYGAFNYHGGMTHRRVAAAAIRHIAAHLAGEDLDPETGLRHIDHAEAEINMLGWLVRHRPDLDDRPDMKGGFRSPTVKDTVLEKNRPSAALKNLI